MAADVLDTEWEIVRRRGRILHVAGTHVWASSGASLLRSVDCGSSFACVGTAHFDRERWARWSVGERIARAGFHDITETSGDSAVGIVTGALVACGPDGIRITKRIQRGSRPLGIARAPDGRLYFGEYWRNMGREEVHVYGSDDGGDSWHVVHTFPAGTIRHVHKLLVDPYDPSAIYVLTGDLDAESAIFVTHDGFRSVERVAGGSQQLRALAAVVSHDGICFATDTPLEPNRLRLLDRTGKIHDMGAISGSGFHACMVGDRAFFATAVEPSTVNLDRFARIYECTHGTVREVAEARKDMLPMRLCQYGTFVLPSGNGDGTHLWTTPWATAGHGTLLRTKLHAA